MNAVTAILLTIAAVPDHFSDVGKKVQDEKGKAPALLGFASDWTSLLRCPPSTRTVSQIQTVEAVQSAADHFPDVTNMMGRHASNNPMGILERRVSVSLAMAAGVVRSMSEAVDSHGVSTVEEIQAGRVLQRTWSAMGISPEECLRCYAKAHAASGSECMPRDRRNRRLHGVRRESEDQEPSYYVTVDFVVINHVKTYTVEFDAWDRPKYVPHETVWVSFWNRLHATFIPVGLVARGWASMSQVRNITRCSDGWMISFTDNVNVITPEIRLIDSPFDWEMRNRRIYRPIRKP